MKLYPEHRARVPEDRHPPLAAGKVHFPTGQPPVEADLVLWAVGLVTPNTAWVPSELLDANGFVRVDDSLRILGLTDGWVVGDVAASNPLRSSAQNFGAQLVARNVIASLRGRSVKPFRPPAYLRGSYLGGPLNDGLDLVTAGGRALRLPRWFGDRVLHDFAYERLTYLGVRPRRPRL